MPATLVLSLLAELGELYGSGQTGDESPGTMRGGIELLDGFLKRT